jgi:hypothetical protein
MTTRTCPICREGIEPEESTFDVPRLPARYGFDDLAGPVHRRCLRRYDRADELRSALARSIAGAEHAPPSRILVAVDGSMFHVYHPEKSEHTIWNLADFVEFTLLDKALDTLLETEFEPDTRIYAGPTRELHIADDGMLRLVSPTGSTPMPSLGLRRLKQLVDTTVHPATADAFVRLEGTDHPTGNANSLVGWVPTPGEDERVPVLLRPLDPWSSEVGPAALLVSIDPTVDLPELRTGGSLPVNIEESTTIRVVPRPTGTETPETP